MGTSSPDTGGGRRAARLGAKVGLSLAVTAVLVAVLEGGSALVLARLVKDRPAGERTRRIAGGAGGPVVGSPFHPYLGWLHAADVEFDTPTGVAPGERGAIQTDARGDSRTPLTHAAPVLRIAVLGGSTMFGVGSSDNAHTVPSQLERLVAERLGMPVEVHNYAVRGYHAFQEMLWLYRRIVEQPVDLVLAISGRNDAYYAAAFPEVEYAFLPPQVWRDTVGPVHALERDSLAGTVRLDLSGLGAYSRTVELLVRLARPKRPRGDAPPPREAFLGMEHLIARRATLEERARLTHSHYAVLAQICRRHGARFVMVLQPTAYTKTRWSEEERERVRVRFDGNLARAEAHGAREREFYAILRALEPAFDLRDLAGTFGDRAETLYVDHAHYNDRGAELLAEAVLASVEADLRRLAAARRPRGGAGS